MCVTNRSNASHTWATVKWSQNGKITIRVLSKYVHKTRATSDTVFMPPENISFMGNEDFFSSLKVQNGILKTEYVD